MYILFPFLIIDLIPRTNLEKWLKYLKQSVPAVPFKASTQSQSNQLGRRKMAQCKNEKALQGLVIKYYL